MFRKKATFTLEERVINHLLEFLHHEGAYITIRLEDFISEYYKEEYDDKKAKSLANFLFLKRLVVLDNRISGFEKTEDEYRYCNIGLSEKSKHLIRDYGSYLNYLKSNKKKEKANRPGKGKAWANFKDGVAVIGTICAIIFGILTLVKESRIQSLKEQVEKLTAERDSLIQSSSTPQRPPNAAQTDTTQISPDSLP